MKILGMGMCWQDFRVGDRFRTLARSITAADISAFVNVTGMSESLFNDLEYIREHSALGGRAAPGALVYATAEGLVIAASLQRTGMAFLGMQLDVHAPTLADDTIHVEVEVTESRAASKGNRGLVRTSNRVLKQDGTCVMTYTPLRMVRGRGD